MIVNPCQHLWLHYACRHAFVSVCVCLFYRSHGLAVTEWSVSGAYSMQTNFMLKLPSSSTCNPHGSRYRFSREDNFRFYWAQHFMVAVHSQGAVGDSDCSCIYCCSTRMSGNSYKYRALIYNCAQIPCKNIWFWASSSKNLWIQKVVEHFSAQLQMSTIENEHNCKWAPCNIAIIVVIATFIIIVIIVC